MAKQESVMLTGRIKEILPAGKMLVVSNTGKDRNGNEQTLEIIAKPNGKMMMNKYRLIVGDFVDLEVSPYDLTVGRITWRYKNEEDYKKQLEERKEEENGE